MIATREQRRQLQRTNAKLPLVLQPVALDGWSSTMLAEPRLVEVWRSRDFLVQVFVEEGGLVTRLSVNRTVLNPSTGRWLEGITWDDLQRLKRECGRGALFAVEVYPADRDIINVASIRHLWVLPQPLHFAWKAS